MSGRRNLAVALWLLTVAASGIALAIVIATRDTQVPESWGFRGALTVQALTWGTVGAVVAIRRPTNANGWLFAVIGVLFAAEGLVTEYVIAGALVVPGGLPWTTALAWTLTWLWVPPVGLGLIHVPLLFPTGRLLSAAWRPVAIFGVAVIVAFAAVMAVAPGPIQQATFLDNPLALPFVDLDTYAGLIFGLAAIPLVAAIVLAIGSLIRRFRQADDEARRQIKWFALAALIAGTSFAFYFAVSVATYSAASGVPEPTAATKTTEVLLILSILGLPMAAGLAILRYRLFDIDRIISRTISYGLVTALLVALFLVVNLAMQGLVSSVTSTNSFTIAASTLLVAALFTPIRRRVQRLVDRRFDRARYDGDRMASAFSTRMRDAIELPTVTADLDRTVRAAIAPTSLALWLREPGR